MFIGYIVTDTEGVVVLEQKLRSSPIMIPLTLLVSNTNILSGL